MVPPARRMEDHVRHLCQRVIESDENSEVFRTSIVELRTAISTHIEDLRQKLKKYPLAQERRSKNDEG